MKELEYDKTRFNIKMKTILIHSWKDEYIPYIDKDDILTFDDALYSIYHHRKDISMLPNQKIICIPTGRILTERKNKSIATDCYTANNMWLINNDNSAYMIIDEIKEMMSLGFEIGGHSHFHDRETDPRILKILNIESKLITRGKSYYEYDTQLMIDWFLNVIGYIPKYYAFPYNEETNAFKTYLQSVGFDIFFGKERYSI